MNSFPPISPQVLSGRIFTGSASVSRGQNLDALARFDGPEAVRDALLEARRHGARALFTLGEEKITRALRLLAESPGAAVEPFQVLPIIPNVMGYVREATEYGLAGAGLRRLLRVGVGGFVRAGMAGALRARRVLHKDFASMLAILYELEMGEFQKFHPPVVFLHHQMTDLALAMGNRRLLLEFAGVMRSRFGAEPGLCTSNFVRLAERLVEWDVPVSVVSAPLNEAGYLMPGGLEEYRRVLRSGRFVLLADRVSPESPTPEAAVDFCLTQAGVGAVVVEPEYLLPTEAPVATHQKSSDKPRAITNP